MSRTTLGFIYSSLFYLLVGIGTGVVMVIYPNLGNLRTIHAHLNLVGFVTFMIFGIAYHILPRFRGRPLYSEGLAWFQFWLANIGLVGFLLSLGLGSPLLFIAIFAILIALAFLLFIYNIGRTLIEPYKEE